MARVNQVVTNLVICRLVFNLRKQNSRPSPGGAHNGTHRTYSDPENHTRGAANLTSLAGIAAFFDIELDVWPCQAGTTVSGLASGESALRLTITSQLTQCIPLKSDDISP